jgi:hypothetical protein
VQNSTLFFGSTLVLRHPLRAPARTLVAQWLQSFREFPPRQKPGSCNRDRVMESIEKGAGDE